MIGERPFYWLMTRLTLLLVRIVGRYHLAGREHVPATGALLVVSNHLNVADPPILGSAVPRQLHFMAKIELFNKKPWGFFVRWFGAFPVRRFEADLQALREAQRRLEAGEAVAMFPEGHRTRTGGLQVPYPGTALIAYRANATILPVAITGTERVRSPKILLQQPRIHIVIGEPFTLSRPRRINGEAVRAGSDEIMHRIAALLPPAYRGVYADPAARVAAVAKSELPAADGTEG